MLSLKHLQPCGATIMQHKGAGRGCIISERKSSTLSMCDGYDELEEFSKLCAQFEIFALVL